jgi:ATP-dependent Lhr-like helicase
MFPASFHPAVREWFLSRFPEGPTPAQERGWPAIASGQDTLIGAPTGSGKTLAGFLLAIDSLYQAAATGEEVGRAVQVVYVSPLKALAVDIRENLETPLREIARSGAALGLAVPDLRVEVRNGDTPPSARAAMLRHPPNFLVTTPESLYLMVTAERSRALLHSVRTVIVDEIHAVSRDKRGSHLALTLERLSRLCASRPQRIGLSATQRPMETVGRLLVGAGGQCRIVDVGHERRLDLAIEVPAGELEAVASAEQMGEVLDRIAALVQAHRTTIVFVNTRRLAERLAHQLGERLGEGGVASHHGSLSKERRLRVENQLRAGDLQALVATASLELGIDIGPVDLVCQIGSPRSLSTFLQRVGRSGHSRGGTPKGRLFPLTRDELVECAALLAGVRAGRLDAIQPPVAPLDILAQHVVAECSAQRWAEDDLFTLVRRAAPYADLSRPDFDEVVDLVSEGIDTGRGRRAAYLHRDGVNGELAGRRGARLAALTSGGAIPETGDYRVVADPDDTFVGTVNEDWAVESMAGDVFLLGSTSWRVRRVEPGTVRVVDAGGAPPSVPFWLGEAPARTAELSEEVSSLRQGVEDHLDAPGAARAWVAERCGIGTEVADMVARYLAAGQAALGCLPTLSHLVVERFFDDSGGMQLVVHSPYGAQVNRALGLALRKRFCVSFDFELQGAASDDAVLVSLGPQHSFPLESVTRFLSPHTVEEVLRQAALASPMFAVRWRWNLNRSLAVLRYRAGRRNPPPIQRMEADDLMAAVFPALAACQENVTGPIEIPGHPLVRQTMHDCLHEAMDVDGLRALVEAMRSGEVRVTCCDTTEPSPLAHEIINGRPYTFLDDAPLEERRSRAVTLRRGLPVEARDLAVLDPSAIARVRAEAAASPRDADELHDLLLSLVVCQPREEWVGWFQELAGRGRALELSGTQGQLWVATERRSLAESLLGGSSRFEEAAVVAIRGHLEVQGPVTVEGLSSLAALGPGAAAIALARLEQEGFALRGRFDPALEGEQWCARRLLARIHSYTKGRLRREIEPVTAQDLMRFLLRWHHVAPGTQREGRAGLLATIEQLQGFEVPAGAWERAVLPARVAGYCSEWLDHLCVSGELGWGRLGVREAPGPGTSQVVPSAATTSRATPVSLVLRADLSWLLQAARGGSQPVEPSVGATREVLDALAERGALFASDLASITRRLGTEVERALWDGVARGLVTADSFAAIRSLLARRQPWSQQHYRRRAGLRRGASGGSTSGGRWSLLPAASAVDDRDLLAEAVAEQLLARWGVVLGDLMARETLALPWREVLWALRRMEARGTIRGGRFVTGFTGEQYALPQAVDQLRAIRRCPRDGEMVRVSATDPLNLAGILTPGPRVAAVSTNWVIYRDGMVEGLDTQPAIAGPAKPLVGAE